MAPVGPAGPAGPAGPVPRFASTYRFVAAPNGTVGSAASVKEGAERAPLNVPAPFIVNELSAHRGLERRHPAPIVGLMTANWPAPAPSSCMWATPSKLRYGVAFGRPNPSSSAPLPGSLPRIVPPDAVRLPAA